MKIDGERERTLKWILPRYKKVNYEEFEKRNNNDELTNDEYKGLVRLADRVKPELDKFEKENPNYTMDELNKELYKQIILNKRLIDKIFKLDNIIILDSNQILYYTEKYVIPVPDEKIVEVCGFGNNKSIINEGPQFILPNGININNKVIPSKYQAITHMRILYYIIETILNDAFVNKRVAVLPGKAKVYEKEIVNMFIYKKNWLKLNPITPGVEDRFYAVLPNTLTSEQWESLELFLEVGMTKIDSVSVYATDEYDYHRYYFSNNRGMLSSKDTYIPEEILAKIKKYYATGKFDESLIQK